LSALTRLVGVYDADGTLRGELTYWVGARLGRAHCSLCDITHGTFRERSDWQACRAGLPVPFDTVHRDELPAALVGLDAAYPYVAAETDDGPVLLVDAGALDACAGDPETLVDAVEAAVAEHGLTWRPPPKASPPTR
jgi:hypothetical protein